MLRQEKHRRLTRVGPGPPMGELLRRYGPAGTSLLVRACSLPSTVVLSATLGSHEPEH